jgi:ferredoxin-nitrate reductase
VQFADLILPAAGHFEKEGTMTNSERRISHLSKVVDPPGEALSDVEILCRFARAMNFRGFDFTSPAEVYAEYVKLTRGTHIDVSGLSYERLTQEGTFQWPVPGADHGGTTRMFTDRVFYTAGGKAKFHALDDPENKSELPDADFPLILTTGRIRDQWHTMTKTGKVNRLRQHIDRPYLEIHPDDAAERAVSEGDIVIIKSRRGEVRVVAKISGEIKRGVVFLPMHWGRGVADDLARANNVTSTLTDPVSKEPDFKFSAVEVNKQEKKPLLSFPLAAAYRFLCTYRAYNTEDQIVVISKEKDAFYNRVLLPEYVNDTLSWNTLQKFQPGEFEKMNVTLQLENEIVSIDRSKKTVTDRYGTLHTYDRLILATGTRANVPKDAPLRLPGVFTMRTRADADALKSHLRSGGHVLIVGGGLLGLELAVALREMAIQVSILQLSSRLMERQTDHLAGQLLLDFIEERHIAVYLNDQVQEVGFDEVTEKLAVHLRSGRSMQANAIVYAVGTQPNIEFAVEAGIESARGITVNDHLQTSDPDIFAIGEIAEHRGKTLGITAAAEKQADVLARFMLGDMQSVYEGSVAMNILKLPGLDFCSIGLSEVPTNDHGYEEVLFIDKAMRYYKKCIIKDDRLEGAILIGDKSEFAEFKDLIENRIELSEKRLQLLRSGKKAEPVLGKLVCSCSQVGLGNLQSLITSGCKTLNELCRQSGAGLGCGSCKPEIQKLLEPEVIKA